MKLYAFPRSLNSRKLLALVYHLDLAVEVVAMTLEEVKAPDFAALNPNRLAPALVDGDLILWESNAIGVYLSQGGPMAPAGGRAQADMLRWLFWEGIHYNKVLGTIFFEAVARPQLGLGPANAALVDDALEQAERYLPVLDSHLQDRRFMLGETLSFVDFAMASAEPYRHRMPLDFDLFPNLQRFYADIASLPAWRRAVG